MSDKKDQKLNLPNTSIPMKANLNLREPEMLKQWDKKNVYKKIRKNREGKEKFILHDGPPYANGNIHLGHAVNKVLKDIVIRSKTLEGYDAPYIPGWDCHGLPIEHQIEKKLGKKRREIAQSDFRDLCRDYAQKQINIQKDDFMRLGVFGDWDKRYASLDQKFEGDAINGFARIFHNGHVEKGFKPVHWCPECGSSLAEAEVEYMDKDSIAIDVKFDFDKSSKEKLIKKLNLDNKKTLSLIIWTTTPWTIPGNQAVCANPEIEYLILDSGTEYSVIASELVESCLNRWSDKTYKPTNVSFKGSELENLKVLHPLYKRETPLLFGDHVTTETGTGFVHTAPAHGVDDFNVCSNEEIEVINPISMNNCYKEDVDFFSGVHVRKVDPHVLEELQKNNALICQENYQHSYPHCWRHKTPLIFMATPQWFISMTKSGLLDGANRAIRDVDFIPNWGRERMETMLKDRPDWCISRQRDWGIPIPLFYKSESGELHPNQDKIFNQASEAIKNSGIDSWADIELGVEEKGFEKSKDIFDVWFDSGITHYCVIDELFGSNTQSDLYLEGSDQHRGWFQSSLLTSIAMKGIAPYKSVLTHGFVVDNEGRKMSKSIGNIVTPQEIIKDSGADILRYWIASTDFRGEMAFSKDIFSRAIDGFRRIRNTMRFMISNIYDFDQKFDVRDLLFIDKVILHKTNSLQQEIRENYNNYNFHQIISKILNFCVNDLGGMYLDVIKDRLYTMQSDSIGRRSAQYCINEILNTLTKLISPILPFTAYEFYENLYPGKGEDIFCEEFSDLKSFASKKDVDAFDVLLALRGRVYQAIEVERQNGNIKNALDCELELTLTKTNFDYAQSMSSELLKFFISSGCEIKCGEKEKIIVRKSKHEKCSRCWHRVEELDSNNVCARCNSNMTGDGEIRGFF
ncbi:MAG: isoleucine--tRNA ligase [Gammaproteobacteria bacterium]|nr:isoleucine--tRNA ligase [Gammaproteobacteria bacterium]